MKCRRGLSVPNIGQTWAWRAKYCTSMRFKVPQFGLQVSRSCTASHSVVSDSCSSSIMLGKVEAKVSQSLVPLTLARFLLLLVLAVHQGELVEGGEGVEGVVQWMSTVMCWRAASLHVSTRAASWYMWASAGEPQPSWSPAGAPCYRARDVDDANEAAQHHLEEGRARRRRGGGGGRGELIASRSPFCTIWCFETT